MCAQSRLHWICMDFFMLQSNGMRYQYNLPKMMNIIQNVLYEYGQVCEEATFQNPHQTIYNFELSRISEIFCDKWSVNQCRNIFFH